jgi:hypothetical protein
MKLLWLPARHSAEYADLLLALVAFVFGSATMLGPASLGSVPERLTPFLRTDVAPTRSAKSYSLPFYWRRGQFTARDVENFQGEIENDFHRQSALTHDALKGHRASDTQTCC